MKTFCLGVVAVAAMMLTGCDAVTKTYHKRVLYELPANGWRIDTKRTSNSFYYKNEDITLLVRDNHLRVNELDYGQVKEGDHVIVNRWGSVDIKKNDYLAKQVINVLED